MTTLEMLLPEAALASFRALVADAGACGAEAVLWHQADTGIAVIGVCQHGDLLTWFATPAGDRNEANLLMRVVLAGLADVAQCLKKIAPQQDAQKASELAANAIRKARNEL